MASSGAPPGPQGGVTSVGGGGSVWSQLGGWPGTPPGVTKPRPVFPAVSEASASEPADAAAPGQDTTAKGTKTPAKPPPVSTVPSATPASLLLDTPAAAAPPNRSPRSHHPTGLMTGGLGAAVLSGATPAEAEAHAQAQVVELAAVLMSGNRLQQPLRSIQSLIGTPKAAPRSPPRRSRSRGRRKRGKRRSARGLGGASGPTVSGVRAAMLGRARAAKREYVAPPPPAFTAVKPVSAPGATSLPPATASSAGGGGGGARAVAGTAAAAQRSASPVPIMFMRPHGQGWLSGPTQMPGTPTAASSASQARAQGQEQGEGEAQRRPQARPPRHTRPPFKKPVSRRAAGTTARGNQRSARRGAAATPTPRSLSEGTLGSPTPGTSPADGGTGTPSLPRTPEQASARAGRAAFVQAHRRVWRADRLRVGSPGSLASSTVASDNASDSPGTRLLSVLTPERPRRGRVLRPTQGAEARAQGATGDNGGGEASASGGTGDDPGSTQQPAAVATPQRRSLSESLLSQSPAAGRGDDGDDRGSGAHGTGDGDGGGERLPAWMERMRAISVGVRIRPPTPLTEVLRVRTTHPWLSLARTGGAVLRVGGCGCAHVGMRGRVCARHLGLMLACPRGECCSDVACATRLCSATVRC